MKKDFIFAEKLKGETKKPKKTKEDIINELEADFAELAEKYNSIAKALAKGASFRKKVGEEQYNLLIQQKNAMEAYRNILAVRIQLLKVS